MEKSATDSESPTPTRARAPPQDETERVPEWRPEWRAARQRRDAVSDDAVTPPLPESDAECARQARAVAWRILHGAAKDADRMNAARFFFERAKEAGSAPEQAGDIVSRIARMADAAEREGKR
jgi:hypothetical protein